MAGGQIEVTDYDDGWRRIEGDPGAPKDGSCWLADEGKRMAWESHQGVSYKPLSDVEPVWWRLNPRG